MRGTMANVIAIFLGCSVGFILKSKIPEKIGKIIMQALGLASLLILGVSFLINWYTNGS